MKKFLAGLIVGAGAAVVYTAAADTAPSPHPVIATALTPVPTAAPPTTETTPSTTTTTTTVAVVSTDSCGRGQYYPSEQYTQPVPNQTPDDPEPDWRRCPDDYRAWLARQGATSVAVSHCVASDQDGYFWTSGDPAYTQYSYEGKEYSCMGVTPQQWEEMTGGH